MPYIVGLTGGIASGKSTASAYFKALGITIVDADQISHSLTAANGAGIEAIRKEFGNNYIVNGALNRPLMRELVFHHPDSLRRLENILHPMIHDRIESAISTASGPYVILDSALLVEKPQWRARVNLLIVIDAQESLQMKRLIENRGLSTETALAILSAQTKRSTRLQYADIVINNDFDRETLQRKVQAAHTKILDIVSKEANL